MKIILLINASPNLINSYSRQLTELFVKQWQQKFPDSKLINRDIGKCPIPHLLQDSLEPIVAPENITASGQQTRDLSNKLIEEIKAADMIVFGVPMHNLSIPSTLKAYFDHIAIAGKTWGGVEYGKQKQVIVITTGGSLYQNTEHDFQAPYIKAFLETIDLKNVTFIRAHGLCKPEEICKQSIINANSAIKNYISQLGSSNDIVNNYLQSGDKKFAMQQYAEAIEEYSAGIALAPNQPVFYVNRAEAKRQLKDISGSTKDLMTAVALDDPNNPQIGFPYYRIARDLAKKHLITNSPTLHAKFSHKAFKGFTQDLEKHQKTSHPYTPYSLYYLGRCHETGCGTAKDLNRAKQYYKESAQLILPTERLAFKLEKRITSIEDKIQQTENSKIRLSKL